MELINSRERVAELGEVFTPDHIVEEMHNLLEKDVWSDPTMIYLEPTCGNGQFVVKAIQKKIKSGLNVLDACNTVFGMDIMEDNIKTCKDRVIDHIKKYIIGLDSIMYPVTLNYLKAIINNNIFVVKDSLSFIKNGEWDRKKFFDKDPTGNKMVRYNLLHKREVENAIKALRVGL